MTNGADTDTFLRRNLVDAACPGEMIERFMAFRKHGRKREQLLLLTTHRKTLLEKMRSSQQQLDCLDYLLFTMKKHEES